MALVNHSIERVGGHIVLEPYTIVVPFVEDHVEDDEEKMEENTPWRLQRKNIMAWTFMWLE